MNIESVTNKLSYFFALANTQDPSEEIIEFSSHAVLAILMEANQYKPLNASDLYKVSTSVSSKCPDLTNLLQKSFTDVFDYVFNAKEDAIKFNCSPSFIGAINILLEYLEYADRHDYDRRFFISRVSELNIYLSHNSLDKVREMLIKEDFDLTNSQKTMIDLLRSKAL